jgi:hypothetical protein
VTSLWCRDVSLQRRGAVALFTVLIGHWVMAAVVSAQTMLIPSLSVSEMYDSNVFYAPKASLNPGTKPEDYITMVTPQINVAHADSLIQGSLSAGAVIAKYVNNPDLDYTGINTAGTLTATNWAQKLSRRISTLSIRGAYQYTPASTAFGAVQGGGLGTGFGTTGVTSPVNAGLITNRVSTHNYTLGVAGGYLLTPLTTVTGTYNYTKMSFGSQSGGLNTQLFDTTGHQGSATLTTQLTRTDTVGATSSVSHYQQDQSSGSGTGSFTTIYGTANWGRTWTQEWSSSLAGGGILTLPVESATPGQSIKSTVAPTVTARINYSSFSEALRAAGSTPGPFDDLPSLIGSLNPGGIVAPGRYTAGLFYTFSVFPSYAIGAGPIRTHVVGMNVTGGITQKLSGQVGMNYAHSGGSGSLGSFDTVGLTAGLRYLIGPVLASLTANYLNFSANNTPQPALGNNVTAFSKEMVMLSLSTAFNSQSFFRMDGFGSWGTPSSGGGTSAPSGDQPGSGSSGAGPGI